MEHRRAQRGELCRDGVFQTGVISLRRSPMPRFLPLLLASTFSCAVGAEPPRAWVDPDTGHRVIRLTSEPDSASLYFNQNGYTADGKHMVYTTPDGISALDLQSHAARSVLKGKVRVIVTGRKTQNVYYIKDNAVCSTDVDSGVTREISKLPPRGSVATVNADETLLAGTYIEGGGQDYNPNRQPAPQQLLQPLNKGEMMEQRLAAHLPMGLLTIDTRTGEVKTILKSTDWLNHLQFSPADPTLLMFCHEGPWHKVDRIWTIRTDGTALQQIHARPMDMEIAGHEFFSADGKTIWYDLQTPKGKEFWLAGHVLATGEKIKYKVERSEWSVHYNVSPDGKLFAGDGGGPNSVAAPGNGQWIYLFTPHDGALQAEKLVDLAKHNYRLEPNVTFTPDGKWLVFRSNMLGPTYVFAVELGKGS